MSTTTRSVALGGLSAVAITIMLSGCSSSGGATVAGVTNSVRPTAGASGGATTAPSGAASPSKGASSSATPGASVGGTSGPYLPAKKGAKLPCNAQGVVVHLSQASGAVHGYLAKPTQTGASVIALKNRTATANGAKAASFAAAQLSTGVRNASGCATTTALNSVAKQTSAYLTTLAAKLSSSSATAQQVSAAEALIQDVASQAQRNGLKLVDRIPDASLLARQ